MFIGSIRVGWTGLCLRPSSTSQRLRRRLQQRRQQHRHKKKPKKELQKSDYGCRRGLRESCSKSSGLSQAISRRTQENLRCIVRWYRPRQQTRDDNCVLDYAKKLIAIQPEDSQTALVAVTLLQKRGDSESLTLANTYTSTVITGVQKLAPDDRPQQMSLAEWQKQRDLLMMALLNLRADIERSQNRGRNCDQRLSSEHDRFTQPGRGKIAG